MEYTKELEKMGAYLSASDRVCVVNGVKYLKGAVLETRDLRAGAALVLAGLAAEGITTIDEIRYIERGYEDFPQKLQSLGAQIAIVDTEKDLQKFRLRTG